MGTELLGDAGGSLIDHNLAAALERFASHPTPLLVASDYDGTLAPIVDDPAAAAPDPAALAAFRLVAGVEGVHGAILSGRSVDALRGFLGDAAGIELIGNHGSNSDADPDRVATLVVQLTDLAEAHPGAAVEPKTTGAAFHYRHAADEVRAAYAARQIAEACGASIIDGKKVVEAVIGTGDKGTALRRLRTHLGAAAVLFIGDDVSDEAAFAAMSPPDVSIKVGEGETSASHRVHDVPAVRTVFERLKELLGTGS